VNTISPFAFHEPPRPSAASHTTTGEPTVTPIDFNFPSAKNPSELLSGDQNGKYAPSVSGSALASTEFSARTHSLNFPSFPVAVNAT
jgi:hypothetical protein